MKAPSRFARVGTTGPIRNDPGFMDRMEGRTEITSQQAFHGHPKTLKLGPKIEAALAKNPS